MRDLRGQSLLELAAIYGERESLDLLLDKGANPSETAADGKGLMKIAIQKEWYDLLPRLSRLGADPNLADFEGHTALEHAIANSNRDLLTAILKAGADARLVSRITGRSALEESIVRGNAEIVRSLFAAGFTPGPEERERMLWIAFQKRNIEVARLLLAQGASGSLRNSSSYLPLEIAVLTQDGDFVKLFMDYGCEQGRAILLAASNGNPRMIDLLAVCGAQIDRIVIPDSDTPLSWAIRSRQDRSALELLKLGAEPHFSPDGSSLFLLAIARGCHLTVSEMIRSGVDVNAPIATPAPDSLLKWVRRGNVRWGLKNDTNMTPLMLAVDSGDIDTARQLLRAGAKISPKSKKGKLWAVTIATERHDVKMVRLLLGKDPLREQRHMIIRLSEQKARLYDASGAEIFSTSVSTGRKGFSTPIGEFVITDKNRQWKSTIYHAEMPFFQRLSCRDFGLHEGVVPGYPASHGCIRVPAGVAAKLFAMTDTGDRVRIEP